MCADTYQQDKYDIGIKDPTSDELIGMMLTQNKDGTPRYEEYEDDYLVAQYPTGATYANVDPTKELPLVGSDFRSGMGQEVFDTTDPKRYYEAINCDLRFKGMAIPGPTATGIALPATGLDNAALIANQGFEVDLTGWTTVNISQSSTQKHSGTYSAKMTVLNTTKTDYYTVTWNDEYKSKEFVFKMWVYNDNNRADGARIGIEDGEDSDWSGYDTTVATWTQLSVTRTLHANAAHLYLYIEKKESTVNESIAWFDDATLQASVGFDGNPVAFAEFNDELYTAHGSFLSKLHSAGTSLTVVKDDFPGNITDLETFTDDNLYICMGWNTAYWRCSTAAAFTENILSNGTMKFMQTVHTTADTMYGSDSNNTIRSVLLPAGTTAWSGQTKVGADYHDITDLIDKSGALYIMKEDMPYYLDSSGNVQNDLAPELRTETSSTSGKNATIWRGNLYIPAGDQALLEHDVDGVNTWINPADYCTNLATYNGRVAGLAHDARYLFAIIDDSAIVQVLATRKETIDGTTARVWHPISQITLAGCEIAFVSSIVKKRLWIASTDSSQSLYYINLPTGYANPTADSNRSFQDAGYFVTPWLHGDFRGHDKAFTKITLTTEDAAASTYWEAHYQKLASTVWVNIGDFKTSPETSQYIPANSAGTNPVSLMMRFKFVSKVASTADACKLLGYDVRAILYPDIRKIIACTVRCAQEITLKDGSVDEGMYTTIKNAITNARNATWPVEIRDIDGTKKYAKFLPVKPRCTVIKDEKNKVQERQYHCLMQEVALS